MNIQKTDRVLTCFRIGDPEGLFPIFDAQGSKIYPGRWNTANSPMIYTSEYYSTALLEKLVRASAILPPNQHYVRITIPSGVSYEIFQPARHPGWDGKREMICKRFGEAWVKTARSAVLLVPSIPARLDRNILINPLHHDAPLISHDLPEPIWWDKRLYG